VILVYSCATVSIVVQHLEMKLPSDSQLERIYTFPLMIPGIVSEWLLPE